MEVFIVVWDGVGCGFVIGFWVYTVREVGVWD